MKLQDKVALVTGAGSGIGRAIALLFAEEGARVVVNDLRAETAEQTVEAMGAARSRGVAIPADVSRSDQVKALFAELDKRFGRLDILVNNAGIGLSPERIEEANRKTEANLEEMASGKGAITHLDFTQGLSDDEWTSLLAVHLNGTFFCSREALKLFARQNRGVIINMSSVAGLHGLPLAPHYSAAKAGILGFTRALAQEVASRNIRVNAICPGWIDTPMVEPLSPMVKAAFATMIPMGRFAAPHEVASVALFLASDDSSYITGQWISPNGGMFIA